MISYYTIYQVTNKVNGKIYIGSHKTTNLDDGYMGSGKYLRHAQEKHGIDNFEKKILFVFDNPEDMYIKEAELVDINFIACNNTYNLKVGGFGGWDYINNDIESRKRKNQDAWVKSRGILEDTYGTDYASIIGRKGNHQRNLKHPDLSSEIAKLGHDEGWFSFKGKKHSDETKVIISEKAKDRLSDPSKNSQYGSMWIHSINEKRNKKIKRGDPIPEGWLPGRKMKF